MFIWRVEMWDYNAPTPAGTFAAPTLAFETFREQIEQNLTRDRLGALSVEFIQDGPRIEVTWHSGDRVSITGEYVQGSEDPNTPELGDFRDLHTVRVLLRRWLRVNQFDMRKADVSGEASLWGKWEFRRDTFI